MEKLKIGDTAPDFTANSTRGEVSLEKLRGQNIVLYFYPKDMTPGCSIQAQDFSALYKDFKQLNTEIIGISMDSLSQHQKFCVQEGIIYPLLLDLEGKICSAYNVIKEKSMFSRNYKGIERTTFLINHKHKIEKIWNKVKPNQHAVTILNIIKQSQFMTKM